MMPRDEVEQVCREQRILRDRSAMGPEERAGLDRARLVTGGEYADSGQSVVQATIGGHTTLLGCCDSAAVNADSGRVGALHYCHVTNSMMRSLAWLCASAWASDALLPALGRLKGAPIGLQPTAIPPGLELVWWSVNLTREDGEKTANLPGVPPIAPRWLPRALQRLDPVRRHYMKVSFAAAVDYLWLHEAAHITCGHLNEPMVSPKMSRAMEIEADRWSMLRVFEASHLQAPAEPGAGHAGVTAAVLGICLAHILSFAKRVLRDKTGWNSTTSLYPPLWFRTDDILRMEELAAERVRKRQAEAEKEPGEALNAWAYQRAAAHCSLLQGLLDLCNVHPLFGQWLGPAIDGVRSEAGGEILEQARQSLRW